MDKKFSKKSTHACLYSGKGERGHFETYTSLYHIGYEGGEKRGGGGGGCCQRGIIFIFFKNTQQENI